MYSTLTAKNIFCESVRSKVYTTIIAVGASSLGQELEKKRRRGRPSRYLQHNPEKTKHRCSSERSRQSNGGSPKEVRSRWLEILP